MLGLIRGLDVSEAREVLRFCERGAADEVAKLLDSAVANAEHNDNLPPDELFVDARLGRRGPDGASGTARAPVAAAPGSASARSHVTIVVARYSEDELLARSAREAASGTGAAAERRRRLTRRRRVAASDRGRGHDHDHDERGSRRGSEIEETAESPRPRRRSWRRRPRKRKSKAPTRRQPTTPTRLSRASRCGTIGEERK